MMKMLDRGWIFWILIALFLVGLTISGLMGWAFWILIATVLFGLAVIVMPLITPKRVKLFFRKRMAPLVHKRATRAFWKVTDFIHLKRATLYLILIMFAVIALLPIWVAFTTSLKTEREVTTSNPLQPPTSPTLDAYGEALGELGGPMINSLMFATGAVVFSVAIGSVLGYIFAKIRFRFSTLLFIIVSAGTFLPYTTIIFPLFSTISGLGLHYSIPGMILTHMMYGIPVCALLFRNFYAEIPQSTIDKAKKRGARDWDIYRKIILPASGAAIVTAVMYQFTSIWNDYLFGLFLGGAATEAMPVTVKLATLFQGHVSWSVLMAGAIIIFLPVVLLYIFLLKYFIRGLGGKASEE